MNPSAPAPPDLLMTTQGFGEMLYLDISGEMKRAITSAPPPAPAGTTNSTGLVGTQAAAVPIMTKAITKEQTTTSIILKDPFFMCCLLSKVLETESENSF
jgi:hypothetical protein